MSVVFQNCTFEDNESSDDNYLLSIFIGFFGIIFLYIILNTTRGRYIIIKDSYGNISHRFSTRIYATYVVNDGYLIVNKKNSYECYHVKMVNNKVKVLKCKIKKN